MVLPVLLAVTFGLTWLVVLAGTQVRVVDAAREVARAAARHEDPATAEALGRRVAPNGAHIEVRREAGIVVVDVMAEVAGPGGLFTFLPSAEVRGHAVAAEEPS